MRWFGWFRPRPKPVSYLAALQRTLKRHRMTIDRLTEPMKDETEFKRRGRMIVLGDYTEEAAALEILIRNLTVEEVTR